MQRYPGRRRQRLEHPARTVRKHDARQWRQRSERGRGIGERRQVEIRVEQAMPRRALQRQATRLDRIVQCMRSDRGEILAPLRRAHHQALQPGVFELLGAPQLRQRRTVPREQAFGQRRDRLHVEERAVSVEDQRVDGNRSRGVGNHRDISGADFSVIVCKNCTNVAVVANAAKKIGVTLACNPLVPWWAILGSNQWPHPCEGCALPLS